MVVNNLLLAQVHLLSVAYAQANFVLKDKID